MPSYQLPEVIHTVYFSTIVHRMRPSPALHLPYVAIDIALQCSV